MEKVIEIIEVSKTYVIGDEIEIRALRGVSFTIERGEFVAIMGASGSGKSTLMNLIGCLDRPTGGRYLLEGVDVASLDEEKLAAIRSRRIGFIFQNFNLLSRTSTLENVELPLFYSGWPADGAARAQSLVTMVGLNGRERNYPSQLSGGQQQRVAVARALINEPAILLADEPTGNLDSTNSAEILEMMTRLNRERGLTIIIVTHDAEVAAYTDRIITFRDGVIVSDTPTSRAGDHQRAAATTIAHEAQAAVERKRDAADLWDDGADRGGARDQSQQTAGGADDARDFYRGGGGDRDGGGGQRRALFGAAADPEPRHESIGHIARRADFERSARGVRQHVNLARGGCGSDRQAGGGHGGGQLHGSAGRAGGVRQSQLEHEYRRDDAGLPGYSRLAGDQRAAVYRRRDAERGAGVSDRADGSQQSISRRVRIRSE